MLLKVIPGKEGWLFLDNDSNGVIKQITGELLFSERQLLQWQYVLETRYLWLRERGIAYFLIVVPNKACVYPEYLPAAIHLAPGRCINQLNAHLDQNSFFRFVYPIQDLRRAKAELPVYRKLDTHWNSFGAFTAYQTLMPEITKLYDLPIIQRDTVDFFAVSRPCDLGAKLGIAQDKTLDAKFLNPRGATCTYKNEVQDRGNLIIFEQKNQDLPRAVMFRDSFGTAMLHFLAESFSRLVVVWQPNIDYGLILQEKPDVVISQQIERFIVEIPNDSHGKTNAELIQQKLQQKMQS